MPLPPAGRLAAFLIVLFATDARAQTGTWQSTGNGPYDWTDAGNWVGGVVPNSPSATADMSVAALTGFPDISLNQGIQLSALVFGSGPNRYFFEAGAGGNGYFAFGSGGGGTITAGSQGATFFAPLTATSGLTVNTTDAGGEIAFAGRLEPAANQFGGSLFKTGPGSVAFINQSTAFLDLTVSGGSARMESATALAASTMTLNVTNGLRFSTLTGATVNGLIVNSGAGLSLINDDSPQAPVTLTIGAGGSSIFGASLVTGPGGLNVASGGTVSINTSVAQTYSGGTTVSSGILQLNTAFLAPPTNLLNPNQTLTLGAGQLQVSGQNAVGSQAFSGFNLAGGQAAVFLQQSGSGTTTLTLPNTWARVPGATVDFSLSSGTTVASAPVTSGFIGAFATVNGQDWAAVSGGALVPFAGYMNNTFTAGTHVNVTGAQSTGDATVASVRMDDGSSLALTGVLTVSTGGVLLRAQSITGGTLRGPTAGELILNTGTSGGGMVSSTIADNGGATALTVAGIGGVTLGGANTYSGPTYLNSATTVPSVADGGLPSGLGQSSNAAANLVLNGAALTATNGIFSDRLFTLGPAGGGFAGGGPMFFSNVNAIAFTGVGSRTLTLTGGSTDTTNPNVFSPILGDPDGGSLGVTITGGAWVLGANNFFTGPLLIELGATLSTDTLTMRGVPGPLGASNRPDGLSLVFNATLRYTGGSVTTDRPILSSGLSALNVTNAGATVTLTGGGIQGDLTLSGPGTVTFAGQRPYTGSVTVNNGKAILADNNAFAGVTLTTNVPTGFQFAPGVTTPTIGGFGGTGNISLQTTAAEPVNLSLVGGSNYSGVLSGPGSVTVVSGGHIFSGANTYSGGTTINANGITAGNTTGSATGPGPVIIHGGALDGSGSVTGPVTLQGPAPSTLSGNVTVAGAVIAQNSSAFLQPGPPAFAAGVLTAGNMTLNGGATYIFNMTDWSATPVAGADFDQIRGLTGASNLDLTGSSSGNKINLIIQANPSGFDNTQGRQWQIVNFGTLTNFSPNNWFIDTSLFQPALGGATFSLAQSGAGGITLTFNPVPEPWAVLSVCGLIAGCWTGRLRRTRNLG